jgi:hypothetical protein
MIAEAIFGQPNDCTVCRIASTDSAGDSEVTLSIAFASNFASPFPTSWPFCPSLMMVSIIPTGVATTGMPHAESRFTSPPLDDHRFGGCRRRILDRREPQIMTDRKLTISEM